MWPGLESVAQQNSNKMTCMVSPQTNYVDDLQPEGETFVYFMKLFREQNVEAGLSGSYGRQTNLSQKLDEDIKFIDKYVPDYTVLSLYQGNMTDEEMEEALKREKFDNVRTILKDYDESAQLVSLDEDGIVRQSGICDGYSHTFREDLRMMSIQTALGYSNIQVDISPVAHPSSDKDTWEKLSRKFAGNTSTFWKPFRSFQKTTLAESDMRIRRFLALDYQQERKGDVISLHISNFEKEASFILRTHGEKIEQAAGAEFEKIEDGAYLVTATEREVRLDLEEAHDRYYYFEDDDR